jgi:hypothetical protein
LKLYANLGGDSGIHSYEYDADSITVVFTHHGPYRYSARGVGSAHVARMKRLADSGRGLNTYINMHPEVKNGCDR